MNRKASSILVMIIEILAVLVVGVMITKYAVTIAHSETVTKINLANNLQMMMNTLVATPGDAVVAYPYNASKFNLILSQSSVTVTQPNDLNVEKIIRGFNLPAGYEALGVLEQKDKACLEKKSTRIILRECNTGE
ncbi:hypothetical protein HZC30_00530 [Candidatus Woesearchaeota archaeon]|nr:hypothetical protein [Candidatus Woesearchaeota archaeon]